METLRWKARIAVLWVMAAVAMSAHMILLSLDPGAMKKAATWSVTAGQGEWVMISLFWLVPLWLAFASVTMKDAANRGVNLVAGVAVTLVNLWHFLICGVPLLQGGPFDTPLAQHVLTVGSSGLATALIAWYAWKWPRQEARAK